LRAAAAPRCVGLLHTSAEGTPAPLTPRRPRAATPSLPLNVRGPDRRWRSERESRRRCPCADDRSRAFAGWLALRTHRRPTRSALPGHAGPTALRCGPRAPGGNRQRSRGQLASSRHDGLASVPDIDPARRRSGAEHFLTPTRRFGSASVCLAIGTAAYAQRLWHGDLRPVDGRQPDATEKRRSPRGRHERDDGPPRAPVWRCRRA